MEIDYSPFLCVVQAGRLWWPVADAIKLGAGYLPVCDDARNPVPVLRATTNQVRANERTLLGVFHDDRLTIERPITVEREGVHFVDAGAFLDWLSTYLSGDQSGMSFPNELARLVRMELAKSAAEAASSADGFESLTLALEDHFETPLDQLPVALRPRVEHEFFPMHWDSMSAEQRRSMAVQMDYQHDPATEQNRKFWWSFYGRMHDLEKQIASWEAIATPTAAELALQETRLTELREELAGMKRQERQSRRGYFPGRNSIDGVGGLSSTPSGLTVRYIAYPKAMALLTKRLTATPEELAAWVFAGHEDGGIAAFVNANGLDSPPAFDYCQCIASENNFDYLSPLMGCWFREEDIARFEPAERYMTGQALIERWSLQPAIQPEAFIRAKIAESRLVDLHPITGFTQGSNPGSRTSPPLEIALFALSDVEGIELEDFAQDPELGELSDSPCPPVAAAEIRHRFHVLKDPDANESWWKAMMRAANRNGLSACRVGQGKTGPSGSLWRSDLVGGWLVDRHAKGHDGMSSGAVRAALKKMPGCEDIAEELFPADE